jgi:hypothetical protein
MLDGCMKQFHIYIFVVIFSVLSIFSVNAWASLYEEGNDLSFLGQFPIAPWQYQQMLGKEGLIGTNGICTLYDTRIDEGRNTVSGNF